MINIEKFKAFMDKSSYVIEITKAELDNLSEKQRNDFHYDPNLHESPFSIFHAEFEKPSWYAHNMADIPMAKNDNDESDSVQYIADHAFDYLCTSNLVTQFPAMAVKEKVKNVIRIAWCNHPGVAVYRSANCKLDTGHLQTCDNVALRIHLNYLRKKSFPLDRLMEMTGNVSAMVEFNDRLPKYTSSVPQAWLYGRTSETAFPLFRCEEGKKTNYLKHNYTFMLKINDLLRMQALDYERDDKGVPIKDSNDCFVYNKDNRWRDMPVNLKWLEGNYTLRSKIPIPRLRARYSKITKIEKNNILKSCNKEKHKNNKENEYDSKGRKAVHEIPFDDYKAFDAPNPTTFDSNATVEIESNEPTRALFWVAESQEALKYNCHGNYTTCPTNLFEGQNPCEKYTFTVGGKPKAVEMPCDANFDEEYHLFGTSPFEIGYNVMSISYEPSSVDNTKGSIYSSSRSTKGNLVVRISNKDPYHIEDSNKDENAGEMEVLQEMEHLNLVSNKSSMEFILKARALISKKITFFVDKDGLNKFEILNY